MSPRQRVDPKCFRCGYGRMLRFTSGVKCYQCGARPEDQERPVWSHAERSVADAGEKSVLGAIARGPQPDPMDGHRSRTSASRNDYRRRPRLSPNGKPIGRPPRQLPLTDNT